MRSDEQFIISRPQTVPMNPDREKFYNQEFPEVIQNLAVKMAVHAPKKCDCCSSRLNVSELAYRLAINIEPFLCYTCLKKYEAKGAVILPSEEAGYPRKLELPQGVVIA